MTNCNWILNEANFVGEKSLGDVSNYLECATLVQKQCPDANIASVEPWGGGECKCQYGNNFEVDPQAQWEICGLSTFDTTVGKYNFQEKVFFYNPTSIVFFDQPGRNHVR
jgi:hypothetical protein